MAQEFTQHIIIFVFILYESPKTKPQILTYCKCIYLGRMPNHIIIQQQQADVARREGAVLHPITHGSCQWKHRENNYTLVNANSLHMGQDVCKIM